MKKTISRLIALVLVFSLAIPAFAATSGASEPYAVCNHTYGETKKVEIKGIYVMSTDQPKIRCGTRHFRPSVL